jgi:hypothetical protein
MLTPNTPGKAPDSQKPLQRPFQKDLRPRDMDPDTLRVPRGSPRFIQAPEPQHQVDRIDSSPCLHTQIFNV